MNSLFDANMTNYSFWNMNMYTCLCVCPDEPSMCYYYDGDGVCEDFERETGVKDCGLYTPNGFLDQWATTVEVSHEDRLYCPADVAAGYPAITKVCVHDSALRCIHTDSDGGVMTLWGGQSRQLTAFCALNLCALVLLDFALPAVAQMNNSHWHWMFDLLL